MNTLEAVARELLGLFVDDGAFALEILAVIVLAAVSAALVPGVPLVTGGVLFLGCLGVLLTSIATAARRR
jgi:hypothetical protein